MVCRDNLASCLLTLPRTRYRCLTLLGERFSERLPSQIFKKTSRYPSPVSLDFLSSTKLEFIPSGGELDRLDRTIKTQHQLLLSLR